MRVSFPKRSRTPVDNYAAALLARRDLGSRNLLGLTLDRAVHRDLLQPLPSTMHLGTVSSTKLPASCSWFVIKRSRGQSRSSLCRRSSCTSRNFKAAILPIVVIVTSIRVTPRPGKNVLLLLSPVGRSLAASSFRLASCEGRPTQQLRSSLKYVDMHFRMNRSPPLRQTESGDRNKPMVINIIINIGLLSLLLSFILLY